MNRFALLILARGTLLPPHNPAIALRDLTTKPLSSRSHSPRIPLASPLHPPHITLTSLHIALIPLSHFHPLHAPRTFKWRAQRIMHIQCHTFTTTREDTRGQPPDPRSYPVFPFHLATWFTHHSANHSHSHSSLFAHTHMIEHGSFALAAFALDRGGIQGTDTGEGRSRGA